MGNQFPPSLSCLNRQDWFPELKQKDSFSFRKEKKVKSSPCSSSTAPIWGIIVGLLMMGSLKGKVWAANKIECTEQRGVTPAWERFKELICNPREQLITPRLPGNLKIRFNL